MLASFLISIRRFSASWFPDDFQHTVMRWKYQVSHLHLQILVQYKLDQILITKRVIFVSLFTVCLMRVPFQVSISRWGTENETLPKSWRENPSQLLRSVCFPFSFPELKFYKVNYVLSDFHDLWALETCKKSSPCFLPALCPFCRYVASVRQQRHMPRD